MLALPLHTGDCTSNYKGLDPNNLLSYITGATPEDITSLVELRKAAITASPSSETNITHLTKYAAHLLQIVPKLNEYESFELHWSAAFSVSKHITSSSLYLELACVVWNLAATYSINAVRCDRKTTEGLKLACKYFQLAAGALDTLLHKISPRVQGPVFPNLSEAGIQFAMNLMLSQAQATFYCKAVSDREAGIQYM
jgi:programmed cell death 6-interacting protein